MLCAIEFMVSFGSVGDRKNSTGSIPKQETDHQQPMQGVDNQFEIGTLYHNRSIFIVGIRKKAFHPQMDVAYCNCSISVLI